MKIGGSYEVPAGVPQVYGALQDPDVLAACMPGCKRLVRTGDNEYEMQMSLAIASISGLFNGKVRISEQTPPSSFRLAVDGSGRIGFVKGDGVLTLTDRGGSTEVAYDGEVQAGGVIAGVGQRLMETTAKMLIKRFFEKLSSTVSASATGAGG